jgi:hypothetical protein
VLASDADLTPVDYHCPLLTLPLAFDWRWLLERTDTPWYPSARLFPQPGVGDSSSDVAIVGEALARELRAPIDTVTNPTT